MSHTIRDKKKLLHRVRRIRGQLAAVERALESEDEDCFKVLQTVAASRGALHGLMAEIIQGHIDLHILDPHQKPTASQTRASKELMEIIKTYLR